MRLSIRTFKNFKRHLELLPDRKLLQLEGRDVPELLQGLITNDIAHLKQPSDSMYAMFLNAKGRVLADTIIYRTETSYLLDLHSDVTTRIESHLQKYLLRRKVTITRPNLSVTALLGAEPSTNTLVFKDPRTTQLGFRILTNEPQGDSGSGYKEWRYRLGIGEGPSEIIPEKSFPLECNCDYLNGVSFHKGCYLGQELTARTYHTGVVRKRLMPLILEDEVNNLGDAEPILVNGETVGRLRGIENKYGLGLLRIENVLNADLQIGKTIGRTEKPEWWPN